MSLGLERELRRFEEAAVECEAEDLSAIWMAQLAAELSRWVSAAFTEIDRCEPTSFSCSPWASRVRTDFSLGVRLSKLSLTSLNPSRSISKTAA